MHKEIKDDSAAKAIEANPQFKNSLLKTISDLQSGNTQWHTYEETFKNTFPTKK